MVQTALVTGVTGYIGAHVAKVLLAEGWHVKGTVRDAAKASFLREAFKGHGDAFETVTVPDMAVPGAFKEALTASPIDVIFHVASPFKISAKDPYKDLLEPAKAGTVGILEAAKQYGGASLKRIVLTSSTASIMQPHPEVKDYKWTEKDWNNQAFEMVEELKEKVPGVKAYEASKNEAEKAAWAFMKDNKPSFDLVAVNPCLVLGPPVNRMQSPEDLSTSIGLTFAIVMGLKPLEPHRPMYHYVDVRDVALAHVRAATSKEATNERILLVAGAFCEAQLAQVVKDKCDPKLSSKIVPFTDANKEEVKTTLPSGFTTTRAQDWLKIEYLPFEKTVLDTVKSLEHFMTA